MRPCTANFFAAFLLVTLNWLPCISLAHDFWIDPDRFDLQAGDTVDLTLRQGVGMKGSSLPYLTPLIDDFSTTDRLGRTVIQSVMGNDPAAVLVIESGTTLVGYQSNRDYVEIAPQKFRQYLDDEGLESVLTGLQVLQSVERWQEVDRETAAAIDRFGDGRERRSYGEGRQRQRVRYCCKCRVGRGACGS